MQHNALMEFYRYEELQYEYGPRIYLSTLYLVRETPCGYWISTDPHHNERPDEYIRFYRDRERWVSKTSRKRYAYPTKEEAMDNFKARKRRQIEILTHRLDRAQQALQMATEGAEEPKRRRMSI